MHSPDPRRRLPQVGRDVPVASPCGIHHFNHPTLREARGIQTHHVRIARARGRTEIHAVAGQADPIESTNCSHP